MPDRSLVLATANPGKIAEITAILGPIGVPILPFSAFPGAPALEEAGATYLENAAAKARAAASFTGHIALADDSGLEVEALGGEPGVHSARYLGSEATDAERLAAILRALRTYPWPGREARFRCVVALANPTGTVRWAEGCCEGFIAFEARGDRGFGYDPVFFVPECKVTMAELDPEVKNRISHRARALRAAREILREMLNAETSEDGEGIRIGA